MSTTRSKKLRRLDCAVCNRAVKRDGYVVADDHEAFRKLQAENQREHERHLLEEAEGPLAIPFDFPNAAGWGSVPWLAFHDGCRERDNGYHIEIESLQTEFDLIERMQHMNGKTWLPFTNWHEFVTKVSGAV
ncbi:hypothetical protein PP404_25075 [Mycobacteroides abscessus]|nr:hypothetical protein [Mycobacteroides abscessus]MDM2180496.1 hypothetical protein [Mycobacteroides abscessus]MDM2209712.1 hypothetical protein [Mycobacteroides abscessus]MDM2214738.1 hypothetical protein [Mycobacteroides abscessus]MDM2219729.1 hypothetical protein [Mycobacteroides abscessus]